MLYERWRQTAQEQGNAIALRDLTGGQQWSFDELAHLTEKAGANSQKIAHPQGPGAGFVFSVLNAWRNGQVVCPLEAGQSAPAIGSLPPDIVHLKTTSATTG